MQARGTVRAVVSVFLVLVFIPIVSQFFIEFARQKGLYENPSGTINVAMDWVIGFTDSTYFWFLFPLILGLTTGVWLDYFLKTNEIQKPDYRVWDIINKFTLEQAAYLLAGVEPTNKSLKECGAHRWYVMLNAAIDDRELIPIFNLNEAIAYKNHNYYPTLHSEIARKELRKYAEKKGLKPRLLFKRKLLFFYKPV